MKSKTGIGFESESQKFTITTGSSLLFVSNKVSGSPVTNVINLASVLEIRLSDIDPIRKHTRLQVLPPIYQTNGFSLVNLDQVQSFLADLE